MTDSEGPLDRLEDLEERRRRRRRRGKKADEGLDLDRAWS